MISLADVVPFRGLRYNPAVAPDLSLVISPPYDIISGVDQQRYHEKNALNAIHLDYGIELPGDDGKENRYSRAAATFRQWQNDRALLPDSKPAFYLCREEFLLGDGSTATREGFIALIRLADFSEGIVLPHEETASGPKQDRLRLMQATEANLSAIFCLYADPGQQVIGVLNKAATDEPAARVTDEAGTVHSLWIVDAPDATAAVNRLLSDKTLLIADGHHRYETALAYRDKRRAAESPSEDMPCDYMMVYLSDLENTGQSILPIHRFVSGLSEETTRDLLQSLEESFTVEELTGSAAECQQQMTNAMDTAGDTQNIFGMYFVAAGTYHILTGRQSRPMISTEASSKSSAYRSLDIAVLDQTILSGILEISTGGSNENASVRFVERTEKALSELNTPGLDAAFFVNPTSMEEIKSVAEAGEKMPQKSTYFYPKPVTGLVFRSFNI
ncbi:MAG: DUF1015 domain-containing protein [Thermoleophilia bacterium]|nr:DUF1015 domain-containing protein [Thermoleophilia bacterium]